MVWPRGMYVMGRIAVHHGALRLARTISIGAYCMPCIRLHTVCGRKTVHDFRVSKSDRAYTIWNLDACYRSAVNSMPLHVVIPMVVSVRSEVHRTRPDTVGLDELEISSTHATMSTRSGKTSMRLSRWSVVVSCASQYVRTNSMTA
jgi:hypothetical protein